MTGMELLDAMNAVDGASILSAQKRLCSAPKRQTATLRRLVSWAAVLLLLAAASFVTAMAVSREFRESVFSFFRIEQTEVIPQHDEPASLPPESETDAMAVEPQKILIGDVIEGTYVQTPQASHGRNGAFFICTDEVMMNSGNHYDIYMEEDGQFVLLEEQNFCQDYTILGNDFHVEFQWVDCGGHMEYTYVDTDVPWHTYNLAGSTQATLFTFDCMITLADGTATSTAYPVLINLETGELMDILAGTGAEQLPNIYQAAISQDLRKMVLVQWDGRDYWLYYADLIGKKLYSVDALSGEHAEKCALTDTTLTCWTYQENPDTRYRPGSYKIWAIDLETLARRELFSSIPATAATDYSTWSDNRSTGDVAEGLHFLSGFSITSYWGNMYAGSKFAIEVDRDRNVYVIDLADGTRSQIEGFLWPELEYPEVSCQPSADGEKLLIYTRSNGYTIDAIGVLDFSQKAYFQFSRENLNFLGEDICWFDNNSIIIRADSSTYTTHYYIYRLLD